MDKGSVIQIEYTLYDVEADIVIETNRVGEHESTGDGDADTSQEARPLTTIVGSGRLIPGFEEHLEEAEEGVDYTIEIPAEKGYGAKDPDLIETITQDRLLASVPDPRSLQIGSPVTINNRVGVLQLLAAGRARIDFNHPLAGKILRYEYTVTKVINDEQERLSAIVESMTGRSGFSFESTEEALVITLPDDLRYDARWGSTKFDVVGGLREHAGAETIIFREIHPIRVAGDASEEE